MPLLTAFGIAGVAVGFAAKDALSNIISGFFLLLDRPFKIGERILIDGGKFGIVDGYIEKIGLRSTAIRMLDNNLLYIPNSKLANNLIVNLYKPKKDIKISFVIGISYDSDVNKAIKIIENILKSDNNIKKDSIRVVFESFGDFSLNIKVIFVIKDLSNKLNVLNNVNTRILEEFNKNGIEIPYPIMTILRKK